MPFAQWERVRTVLRPLFIHEKELRRLRAGEHLTFLFENAQSVWYQVEEMLRVERITAEDAIAHELGTYNELIPREDELSTQPSATRRSRSWLASSDTCILSRETAESRRASRSRKSPPKRSAPCSSCGSRYPAESARNSSSSPQPASWRSKSIILRCPCAHRSALNWRGTFSKICASRR